MKQKEKTKLEIARIRIVKYLIKEFSLDTQSRSQALVYQRFYLYYELRKNCTLQEIGEIFRKDHASVLHGIKMHEAWTLIGDKQYLSTIKAIKEEFQLQMMEGFSKGDELRISLEDVFQDVASLNIKMKVNKAFIEKLPEIKTFQHLHDLYLEHIE
jgi:hypothetical protein